MVHRAIEKLTGKNWVAKFMRCRKQDRDMIKRQIEAMNRTHHPKLLQLHEAFEQPGEVILIMELYVYYATSHVIMLLFSCKSLVLEYLIANGSPASVIC